MKTLHSKPLPMLVGILLIAGCRTVPVVPHAMKCDVSPELLAGKCATPTQIASDSTYAMLIDTMQTDRKALRECGLSVDTLRDAIRRCNRATDEYNRKIDALNSTAKQEK